MALPLPSGLTPQEIAFLCEMELVTVIPRQRLEGLDLLGGPTPTLQPPHRSAIPLWLALLLKRQMRANIAPPPWLHPEALSAILEFETEHAGTFSPPPRYTPAQSELGIGPPFLPSSTSDAPADALPYHWLEIGEILLEAAPDDFEEPNQIRRLTRDLREVRMAKIRAGVEVLDAEGGVQMNGVGGMEIAEARAFVIGVIDGLRKIGASREQARREQESEEQQNGYGRTGEDDEMDM